MKRETDEWADWMTLPPHCKPWPVPNPKMPEPSPGRIAAERKLRQTVTLTFVGMGLMMGAALLYQWVESRELAKAQPQPQVAARAAQADPTPRAAAQSGASTNAQTRQYTLADLTRTRSTRLCRPRCSFPTSSTGSRPHRRQLHSPPRHTLRRSYSRG